MNIDDLLRLPSEDLFNYLTIQCLRDSLGNNKLNIGKVPDAKLSLLLLSVISSFIGAEGECIVNADFADAICVAEYINGTTRVLFYWENQE